MKIIIITMSLLLSLAIVPTSLAEIEVGFDNDPFRNFCLSPL